MRGQIKIDFYRAGEQRFNSEEGSRKTMSDMVGNIKVNVNLRRIKEGDIFNNSCLNLNQNL